MKYANGQKETKKTPTKKMPAKKAPVKKIAKKKEALMKKISDKVKSAKVTAGQKRKSTIMRGVYLGTKSVEGSKGFASHWAIGVGNKEKLWWMEIDGGGGRQKKSRGAKNTINGHDESSWHMKSPRQLMHCGEVARSGAGR